MPFLNSSGKNALVTCQMSAEKSPPDEQCPPSDEANDKEGTSKPSPRKTPAFQAMHAERYRRQDLIRVIELETNRQLICYVAGLNTAISRDDVLFLVDILHNIRGNEDLDFMLHTPGGDMDAAEKLITMVRNVVGTAQLRIIVPDFAKSSGTLIALGADVIMMSDSSELGPIDPQIVLNDGSGNRLITPIQGYLDAYVEKVKAVQANPQDVAAQLMLNKFEPARVKVFEMARARALKLAEKQLSTGMFRPPKSGNFTEIARSLMDPEKWQSHGQMIGHAQASALGLTIHYRDPHDQLWEKFWQLYCHQRIEIQDKHKLFESSFACLNFDDAV